MNEFLSRLGNDPAQLARESQNGILDVDLSCDHGLGFDKSAIEEPFPEMLQECVPVVAAIYGAAMESQLMDGEIPLPNLYYNPSTPTPVSPSSASKYAIVAALGMFLGNEGGYSFACARSRSLRNEFLTSAVQSAIFCREGEEVESHLFTWFHLSVAISFIYDDVYWSSTRFVPSPNLAVSKAFLFNDFDLMDKLMNKALPGYDGSAGYVLAFLHARVGCGCMDHKARWGPTPGVRAICGEEGQSGEGGKGGKEGKKRCGNCGKVEGEEGLKLKSCSLCKDFWVCNVECQRSSWKVHKKTCKGKVGK
ncbi:hypothetical protein TrRE_jg9956 [Triparma retinervis]|uniref:MYND-type domain-containing protein n=1 Tax=Triparma retinervis TaxID=2557542 RepID=A0A9W7KTE9_9STRA|nr:hypothetical protein TrRE_jg9956 [Triparma retinervis]